MFSKPSKNEPIKSSQSSKKWFNVKNKNKIINDNEKPSEKNNDDTFSILNDSAKSEESKSISTSQETSSSITSNQKSTIISKNSSHSNEKKFPKIKFQHQESMIEYSAAIKASKRGHIIMNLIDTESSYILQLISLISLYGANLKEAAVQNNIENHVPDVICYQVSELIFSHETFFYELRKRALEFDETKTTVGDIFIQYFTKSFLHKTYSRFITNYDVAKQYIDTPFLSKFLKNVSHEHPQKLTIQDILISPIQRIPRYLLIIKDLLTQTKTSHPDFTYLRDAEKVILRLASELNTFTDSVINYDTCETDYTQIIEMIISNGETIFIPNRQFLNWYCIKYIHINDVQCQEMNENCYLFLFTDSLFCVKPCLSVDSFKYPRPTAYEELYLEHISYSYLWGINFNSTELIESYISQTRSSILGGSTSEIPLNDIITSISEKRKIKLKNSEKVVIVKKGEIDILWNQLLNDIYIIRFNECDMRDVWHFFIKNTLHTHRTGDEFGKISLKYKREVKQLNQPLKFVDAAEFAYNENKDNSSIWACLTDDSVTYSMIICLIPDVQCILTLISSYEKASCVLLVPGSSYINSDTTEANQSKSEEFLNDSAEKNNDTSKSNNLSCDSIINNSIEPNQESQKDMNFTEETVVINADKAKCFKLLECNGSRLENTVFIGSYNSGSLYVIPSTKNLLTDNHIFKIDTGSSVCVIKYIGGKVIAGLSNGELMVFKHKLHKWNLREGVKIKICDDPLNRIESTINNLLCCVSGKNVILLSKDYQIKSSFQIKNVESSDEITLLTCKSYFVWVSTKLTTVIHCYHIMESFSFVASVDIRNEVAKFLSERDNGDAITLHKIRSLRITCIAETAKYVWIGTSAGLMVVLVKLLDENKNLVLPMRTKVLHHGHMGPVRFINIVKHIVPATDMRYQPIRLSNVKGFQPNNTKKEENILIVSGGEGYHDYNTPLISPTYDIKNVGQSDCHSILIVWSIVS